MAVPADIGGFRHVRKAIRDTVGRGIARACGIQDSRSISTMAEVEAFAKAVQDVSAGPRFANVKIDSASLERILPHKNALILIYCNNNFVNAPGPFPSKLPSASLNLSTYIALYDYGYRNVYELGPLIDIASSRLEFEPRSARP